MRALVVAFVALVLGACGDNNVPAAPDDSTEPADGPSALVPCLDLPTDLPRPPGTQLTCDLLPPGFSVPR